MFLRQSQRHLLFCLRTSVPTSTSASSSSSSSSLFIGRQRLFCSSSTPSVSDKEAHLSYGLWKRLEVFFELFGSKENQDALQALVTRGVTVENLSPLLYTDLKHPLLVKYKFDVFDFAKGSRTAYSQVLAAISSKNFFNSCNGIGKENDDDEFLKSVLNPRIYKSAVDMARTMKDNKQVFLESSTIHSMAIGRIFVTVCDDYQSDVEPIDSTLSTAAHTALTRVVDEIKAGQSESADPPTNSDDASKQEQTAYVYPPGSVIAKVQVAYDVTETYETSDTVNGKVVVGKSVKQSTRLWEYSGCISGHCELAWMVDVI